jgi:hypothetical protein
MLLAGCPRDQRGGDAVSPGTPPVEPRPSVALRVAVVNEPELAEAMNRLRGEWAERTGGELHVSARTWQELSAQNTIDADLIVFPSRYLGELCVRSWLRPVRPNVLNSDTLDAGDYFPLVRHELISWGGEVMALPLGVKPAAIGKRADRPPAISLLALAAPGAISKERLGVLFDLESMKPQIAEPPFVDALKQMVQFNADGAPSSTAAVAVFGYSDRLISVTNSSRNAATAFELLAWFAQADISSQLARAGDGAMPVRRSLATSPAWYNPSITASERDDLGEALVSALDRPECLMIPRIPGVDGYVAALDQAVADAVGHGVAPQDALANAARRWEEITDTRGRDSQRQAYLKHLGISEP